jgi:hypothetical protein
VEKRLPNLPKVFASPLLDIGPILTRLGLLIETELWLFDSPVHCQIVDNGSRAFPELHHLPLRIWRRQAQNVIGQFLNVHPERFKGMYGITLCDVLGNGVIYQAFPGEHIDPLYS